MKSRSLNRTLVTCFIGIGLLPVLLLAVITFNLSRDAIQSQSFNQLNSVNEIKRSTISDYFKTIERQVQTYSNNLMIVDAMRDFRDAFADLAVDAESGLPPETVMRSAVSSFYQNEFAPQYSSQNEGDAIDYQALVDPLPLSAITAQYLYIQENSNPLGSKHLLDAAADGSAYSQLHGLYHPPIRQFLEEFGYYDIFLVDPDTGEIVYSVFKELDYGTSLLDGPYAETNFGDAFRAAATQTDANTTVFSDFRQYLPSYNNAASFIASPIFDGDSLLGVLVFQMPIDRINSVMAERSGMGESGESYLVGSDLLMRSDSFIDPDAHSVSASFRNPETGKIDTLASRSALAGDSGTDIIIDYNGNSVLSAYAPLDIFGERWAILSEIDESEAMASVTALQNISVWVFAVMAIACVVIGYLIARSISRPVVRVSEAIASIADGNLDVEIKNTRRDEIGQLAISMQSMQAKLKDVIEQGVQPLVRKAGQGDLSDRLPLDGKQGFYLNLGQSINELVEVNERFLDETKLVVSALASGDLNTGSEVKFSGSFASVQGDMNQMRDNLAQVIGQDVQRIVSAAGKGQLEQRIDMSDKQGFYRELSADINELMDVNQAVISDTLEVTRGLMNGNLNKQIEGHYQGSFAELKNNLQAMQARLSKVIEKDINGIVKAASQGDLKQRISLEDKEGFYHDLSASINELVDASDEIMSDTSRVVNAMANGDLTQTIDKQYPGSFDQLKQDINRTVHKLTETVGEIKSTAAVVKNDSKEITLGSANLSQRTEEQASSLEETASAMEEMTANVQSNSDNCRQAESLSGDASNMAEEGGDVMSRAVCSMKAISESGKQIDNIINVIDEIAFQTNLLALNASVEAARAGEHGKGFAVVADEVRGLAGRCADAANQVKGIIQDSNNRIDEGSELVNESGQMLGNIVTAVKQVRDIVAEISTASSEQSKGLDEISKAVTTMDEMTQQNAALVEQTAAACESLGDKSNSLDQLTAFFTIREGLKSDSGAHPWSEPRHPRRVARH